MNTITVNQNVTVNDNGKIYTGTVIRADKFLSAVMGQFIVIRLDTPILLPGALNISKTMCFRVNATHSAFPNKLPVTAN